MAEIWAHRGASAEAPENTLAAFGLAVTQGADGVELDVHLSADGVPVVIHDENLKRTANARGYVGNKTLAELKAYDVACGFSKYRGAQIPTLEEVYAQFLPAPITVNVELKTDLIEYPFICERVLELTYLMGMQHKVLFSSFSHATVKRLHALDSTVRTALLFHSWPHGDLVGYIRRHHACAAHPKRTLVLADPSVIERLHLEGIRTHIWTVDDVNEMRAFAAYGADAIITNTPGIAKTAYNTNSMETSL